ncbi:hypothetical protein [Schlegelella aquatica]|uniref:hypothetical protein n=1 Tax=Caldimonas aquatica TaxID=376175 RepID=UPI003750C1C4
MTPSPFRWADVLLMGSLASLASTAVLAWLARREGASPLAPVNAPSHWVHDEQALAQDDASVRYTVTGAAIHHACSVFWAAVFERWAPSRASSPASFGAVVRDALALTAIAAWVDFRLMPRRFTPGFERRLSGRSLAWGYAAFAAGLVAGDRLGRHARRAAPGTRARVVVPPQGARNAARGAGVAAGGRARETTA